MALIVLYSIIWLCVGSFLWYLANTTHSFKSLFGARSACDYCHTTLKRYELIPVFSWFYQKGKCSHCGAKLSSSYLISEILTALSFGVVWSLVGTLSFSLQVMIGLLLACMVFIAMVDIRKKELSIPAFTLALILFFWLYYLTQATNWTNIGIIALCWFALWFIIRLLGVLIHKVKYHEWGQGLGFGDVLFAGLLGLLFGLAIQFTPLQSGFTGSDYYFFIFLTLALHMFASSIFGILGYSILKDERLAFIPYMLWWFLIMTIVLLYFSDTILSFLAF